MISLFLRYLLVSALLVTGAFGLTLSAQAASGSASGAMSPSQSPHTKDSLMRLVVQEARKTANVTPSVALAVAKIESGFRPHVVSSAGAIGVMQIMPKTGRDVFGLSRTDLFDPAINIKAGVTFLDQLITRYDGRIDLALSHYNGGSRVTAGPEPKIIPVTRGYVIKVLAAAQAYEAGWAGMIDNRKGTGTILAATTDPSMPTRANAQAPRHGTRKAMPAAATDWQHHLKEADFWFAAAQATLAADPPSPSALTGGTGPAERLVTSLQGNRVAFRHWLKANQ
jgi:hypothetical protein